MNLNKIHYDMIIHTKSRNYISDPKIWDKRKLKRVLRKSIDCNDVELITVGKLKKVKGEIGLKMVCDRLFVSCIDDLRNFK